MDNEEMHNFIIRVDATLEQEGLPSYTDTISILNALRFLLENQHIIPYDRNTVREAKEMVRVFDKVIGINAS